MPLDAPPGTLPGTTIAMDEGISGGAGDSGIAAGLGTGQNGISQIGGPGVGGAIMGVWNALIAWLKRPVVGQVSPLITIYLVGLVFFAILFWNIVLYHIRIAAEEI